MLLNTKLHHNRVEGTLISPRHFTEEADGTFSNIRRPIITRKLRGRSKAGALIVLLGEHPDADRVNMKLLDRGHLLLDGFQGRVPDWKFERVSTTNTTSVFEGWPESNAEENALEP